MSILKMSQYRENSMFRERRDLLKVAQEANDYATKFVVHGSTQLINDSLPSEYEEAHREAVTDVRAQSNLLDVEINPSVLRFETMIENTKKYSIGNCFELAGLALDYILRNAPKVNAELYCIENGDHTFVVINRKPGSNPANPLTWGNAIICDPWANRIYLAKDYLENLLYFRMVVFHNDKNEYIYQRALEKFNPDQHILAPEHNQNTAYLRLHRNSQNLIINFNNKVSGFKIAIIGFINQLEALHKNAIAVFGESNPKMVFLNKRLEKSRVLLEKMDNLPNVLQQVYASNDYRLVRKKLNKIIIAIYTTIESLRLTDMQTRMYNPTVQKQSSPTSDTSKDHKSTNKP